MNAVGFMVWNPAARLPTVVHETLERALNEAERLTAMHPGERFIVMAPILSRGEATAANAFSDGMLEGIRRRAGEVRLAEERLERALEKAGDLTSALRSTSVFRDKAAAFQAIVADCQCWFDGFRAAHAGQESWERPSLPDREKLRALNQALQGVMPEVRRELMDEEIPF